MDKNTLEAFYDSLMDTMEVCYIIEFGRMINITDKIELRQYDELL